MEIMYLMSKKFMVIEECFGSCEKKFVYFFKCDNNKREVKY